MDYIGWITLGCFAGLAWHVVGQVRWSLRRLDACPNVIETEGVSPPVQVVLCLKGGDPFLNRTLRQLAAQDYSQYRVSIVVDSETDEAWEHARRAQEEGPVGRFEILVRRRAYSQASRRASSLCTALEQLSEEMEIIVLCDGDAVVPSNWLSQLVRGFSNPEVMAVSGNRWYLPRRGLASYSRYYWNALAVPAMEEFDIPWAGSLAFRRELYRDGEFRTVLRTAFSEDTAIAAYLRRKGMRFQHLPRLKVVNEEQATLVSYWGFLVRQMLAARLHHPDWNKVLMHALILGGTVWGLLPLAAVAGLRASGIAWGGVAIYAAAVFLSVAAYERRLYGILQRSDGLVEMDFSLGRGILMVCAMIMTAVIYPAAVMRAWTARRHLWRGILYQIERRGIRVISEAGLQLDTVHPPVAKPQFTSSVSATGIKTPVK